MIAEGATRTVTRKVRIAAHRMLPRLGPRVDGIGVALDLYPWFVEPGLDTVIPLQNYFSAFFPDVATATSAIVDVRDDRGELLCRPTFDVPANGSPSVRLSAVLGRIDRSRPRLGTVTWHLQTPPAVRDRVRATEESFFFWDRSYIGYEAIHGRYAFIHGVDKTELVAPSGRRRPWPVPRHDRYTARPELPVSFEAGYDRLDVVLVNRHRRALTLTTRLLDGAGAVVERTTSIAGLGIVAESFTAGDAVGLDTAEPLRLEVQGLPTRYGRPVVLKRFPDGAVSLMHC